MVYKDFNSQENENFMNSYAYQPYTIERYLTMKI